MRLIARGVNSFMADADAIERCLDKIAKHLCEISEIHGKDEATGLVESIPGDCCKTAQATSLDAGGKKCPEAGTLKGGCCTGGKADSEFETVRASTEGHSHERAQGGCGNTASFATACCPASQNDDNQESRCGETARVNPAADDCCTSADNAADLCEDSCCNETASETDLLCSRTCCDVTDGKSEEAASACSEHLQSAFARFESIIRLSQCLCRKMIREFSFCCCCGQPASQCRDHARTTSKKADMKTCTSPVANCEKACCGPSGVVKEEAASCKNACASRSVAVSPCCNGKDACRTEKQASNIPESMPIHPAPTTQINNDVDLETSRAKTNVALNVSGMTCTGCSRKMLNVLRDIPGLSNPHVTFVSGTAAFDFDPSFGSPDDILPLIESRTGFKLSKANTEYHDLDVILDARKAQEYGREQRDGIVAFEKVCRA